MSKTDIEMLGIKMIDLGLAIVTHNTPKEVADKYNEATAILVGIIKESNGETLSTYKMN